MPTAAIIEDTSRFERIRARMPSLSEGHRRAAIGMLIGIADMMVAEGEDREEVFNFLRYMIARDVIGLA
jgi:hypothetical protein